MSKTTTRDNTKYRVAIRHIAVDNGWEFDQINAATDEFRRGDETIHVVHSLPSHYIRSAQKLVGDTITDLPKSTGKMFVVQEWLTGIEDTYDEKTGKGKNFIVLSPAQVERFTNGKGLAKIKTDAELTPAAPVESPEPAPTPGPAPKARRPRKAAATA